MAEYRHWRMYKDDTDTVIACSVEDTHGVEAPAIEVLS